MIETSIRAVHILINYFPDNDPTQEPLVMAGHANLILQLAKLLCLPGDTL